MSADQRLTDMGLDLPEAPAPAGVYNPIVVTWNMAYVSGHGPLKTDGTMFSGKVGQDTDVEGGKLAARQTGMAILSTLKANLGGLDRVKRIIKVLGMVNAAPTFSDHPQVINGCSELFAELWGQENGVGARSAVGMGSLPGNITVEIEAIFELH